MKRFKVEIGWTESHSATTEIHADSKEEAKEFVEENYDDIKNQIIENPALETFVEQFEDGIINVEKLEGGQI